jgi:outer membrane protein
MLRRFGKAVLAVALASAAPIACVGARADTLEGALAEAYRTNPSLNAQRASVRSTDENVPQALAGYRPRVSITAQGGEQSISTTSKVNSSGVTIPGIGTIGGGVSYQTSSGYNSPFATGLTITQTLFNGFQTANRTRQAEAQVLAARATLAVTEQNVLLNAATAYMNLLRDTAILDLQKSNVEVLQEQLRQTRDRFNVGEVTRTDVAQSESRLAAGRSQLLSAEATYKSSAATYRQVIGSPPGRLSPASPVDRFIPSTLDRSVSLGITSNPAVSSAEFAVDAALLQVKVNEGALLPNVSVQGSVQKSFLGIGSLSTMESYNASILGTLTIPIYQGGAEYSLIRQAKETLGQRRLDLATTREQVRQNVVQAWGLLDAAKANIEATQAQVQAAEIALNGVREEARVGQRTTLDVLNAQQELVNARVSLVTAQRDRVVASYTLLAAVGRLDPAVLHLAVQVYQPQLHYMQVRDAWAGTRNPDGR